MLIYLTSFKRENELPNSTFRYSAVYQPKGYELPKASVWDIRLKSGTWIRPREFINSKNPLMSYRDALYAHYDLRVKSITKWLTNAEDNHDSIALCCWCPYERAAQRQIKEFGSFVCHLSVVGKWLSDHDQNVWYDSDRLMMAVLTQK